MTALDLAVEDIGITERPANSNNVKYNTWYYGKPVSGSAYPWCMTAVQYWYNAAGTTLPYKTASCTALLNWYRVNDPGCLVKTPKANDIGIMCFGAGRYHVGIVRSVGKTAVFTVEGNTSITNDDNGGAVMERTRAMSLFVAFIRPRVTVLNGGKSMDIVKGSTASESNMIKAIQAEVNAVPDGEIGTQTMSDIACQLNADCFPLTLNIYNAPVIIARDIVPFSAGGSKLSDYKNTINGSFYGTDKNGISRPCSILIQDGITIQADACHAAYGKPESVIYKTFTSGVGIMRVKNVSELPKGLLWAVGGVGLLNNYDPAAEGFCKLGKEDFSDVLRKTDHSMLGYKNNHVFLVYCENMTAAEVNALAKKMCFKVAIMMDGGHVAGINGAESFAKINTSTKQYYMIQGVR